MSLLITSIYQKYQIMPSLQLHMLRVGSVASLICESFFEPLQYAEVQAATLLHDMGNILKFNLSLFPDFLEPEGLDYWQGIKTEFEQKYGKDEHQATLEIARELNMNSRVIELIDSISFSLAQSNAQSNDFEKKICAYSDLRVTPFGVVSLAERLEEGRKRWKLNKGSDPYNQDLFDQMSPFLPQIEQQIFAHTPITADQITDEAVNDTINKLKEFDLSIVQNSTDE
jgi:hypothetical protein